MAAQNRSGTRSEHRLALSHELAGIAAECAREAGEYLRAHFAAGIGAEQKSGFFDIVTVHDRVAEEMIIARIFAEHPDSLVVGEESQVRGEGSVHWYVDPIDGTSNFASGFPFYCVSIGAVVEGEMLAGVVYDPERDELFQATLDGATLDGSPLRAADAAVTDEQALCLVSWPYEGRSSGLDEEGIAQRMHASFRAVRRMGSAALSLAYVAAGRADAASELIARPWDVAAGFMLVEQAGGSVSKAHEVGVSAPAPGGAWLAPRYVAHSGAFDLTASSIRPVLD